MIGHKLAFALLLAFTSAAAAKPNEFIEAQVKALGRRYNEIEEQLPRSVRYLQTRQDGNATVVKQAWFDGADDPMKVTVERTEGAARELLEYVPLNSGDPYNGLFVVDREESPLADGGAEVSESRRYFGSLGEGSSAETLRELRKSARFKKDEPLDLSKVPNVTAPAAPDDTEETPEQMKARAQLFETIETVAQEVQASGPPATDPFAEVTGDSAKYRAIHGTASPDGRYVIALGFAREDVDWDRLVEDRPAAAHPTYYAEDEEDIRNYVVDVAQKKILGETGCAYFGTRRRYNHRSCVVTWSPNSQNFVQLWDDKWWSTALIGGIIAPGSKSIACTDLSKPAARKAFAFVKRRTQPENEADLSYNVRKVGNDGLIEMRASENIASGERKGDVEFAVEERVQLRSAANGVRAEVLSVKRAPKDE